jgi:hypothetical protein
MTPTKAQSALMVPQINKLATNIKTRDENMKD